MEWSAFEPHLRHLPEHEHTHVRKAFDLARRLHEEQKRKSGEPYFTHPVAVALKLARVSADAETIIAALLHDTVEDTPITLEEIDREFGQKVTHLINGVTKLLTADIGTAPNLNEQTETLRKIFRLMQEDPRIMVIKLYDRLHNMETAEFLKPERQKVLAQETFDAYAKIADRLSMQDLRYALEEKCYNIIDHDLLQRMMEIRNKNDDVGNELFVKIQKRMQKDHDWFSGNVTMELEKKSWSKLRAQLEIEGAAVSGLSPVTIAFVCPDRDTCYRVMGALHAPWRREVLSFQDFINSPELNGYRGLHTTVILEDGTRVRCKIRTEEMHRYAHEGITLYCFDAEKRKVLEQLLPWTLRIPTLTNDNFERSDAFWQSLQSDILGDSITIHGPDDRVVQVPAGATALDGAFYMFGDMALRAQSLRINGKEVDFQTELKRANALGIAFAPEKTVSREWLRWVNTSVAVAKIRTELAGHDKEESASIGKELIREYLINKRKGFLEEWDQKILNERLHTLGFGSMQQVYAAVAEGRLTPMEIYRHLFPGKASMKNATKVATWFLDCHCPVNKEDTFGQTQALLREYGERLLAIFSAQVQGEYRVRARLLLAEQEHIELEQKLHSAGAHSIRLHTLHTRVIARIMIVALIVLWGLDPVFSSLLLHAPLAASPTDFTILRFTAFLGFSVFLYMWERARTGHIFAKLSLRGFYMWGAGLFFVLVALSGYMILQVMEPQEYLTIVSGATLLVPIINPYRHKKLRMGQVLGSIALIAAAFAIIMVANRQIPILYVLTALILLCSFTAFTVFVDEFKRRSHVSARVNGLLLLLAFTAFVFCLGLVPFSTLSNMPAQTAAILILYGAVMTALPYHLYYRIVSTEWMEVLGRWFAASTVVTLGAQWLLLGHINIVSFLALLLMGAGTTFMVRNQKYHVTMSAPPLSH